MKPCFFKPATVLLLACVLSICDLLAEEIELPENPDNVIGELSVTAAEASQTLVDIAREYDLGYDQIIKANPDVNRWLPGANAKIILPRLYILPAAERRGIVLNIAELRLYYFPVQNKKLSESSRVVYTYPVSIGRMDWKTPIGITKVVSKERDPAWRPPESIRREHLNEGELLPEFIPGGAPNNPLGRFALRLGFKGYLIHGVDERKSYGIGMRVTHGCIRMYPEDIESLYGIIPVNAPVHIMNEPIKIGRIGRRLMLEVHQPFNEGEDEFAPEDQPIQYEEVMEFIKNNLVASAEIDPVAVREVVSKGNGIPVEVGKIQEDSAVEKEKSEYDIAIEEFLSRQKQEL